MKGLDKIKIYLKEICVDISDWRYSPLAGFCEQAIKLRIP
jgi:hypothetical protein